MVEAVGRPAPHRSGVEQPVVARAAQLALVGPPQNGAGQMGAHRRVAHEPPAGQADGDGPVVLARVAEGDRVALGDVVGDLLLRRGPRAVAAEHTERNPAGPEHQTGRHRHQDAEVVAPADQGVEISGESRRISASLP